MVQKRETKAINKLCVREILSLSFVCGACFFEFRGRNLVCFGIAYKFVGGGTGKFAPEAGKARMRTAFFTRAAVVIALFSFGEDGCNKGHTKLNTCIERVIFPVFTTLLPSQNI